ncbi:MAG: hypothetical protein Q9227_007474 [Pyrenula ochraceoflavens]
MNLDQRAVHVTCMTEVPVEELTKTFRDAIEITRSFGLEYLWIDSLCIIQDSHSDWEHESMMMSSVYGGSTINIAAAGAVDAGIARAAQEETGDQYMAGLWRQHIEIQLIWWTLRRQEKSDVAPSWSWASTKNGNDTVMLPRNWHPKNSQIHLIAHVRDVDMTLSGSDPFGQVSGGKLTVSCQYILCGKLNYIGTDSQIVLSSECKLDHRMDSEASDGSIIFVVPLVKELENEHSAITGDGQFSATDWLSGLCLQPTTVQRGEYRRLGYFGSPQRKRDFSGQSHQSFLKLLQRSGQQTAESACAYILDESKYANERYVITIV